MRAILLLVVVAALLVGGFVLWTTTSGPPVAGGPEAGPEPVGRAGAAPPSAATTGTPVEVPAAPAPTPEPPAPDATAAHTAAEIPPFDGEAKYRNWSLEQLSGARDTLGRSFLEACKPVFDARFEAGLYEEEILEPGVPTRAMSGTAQVRSGPANPDGRITHRIVEIPIDEYPQLKALCDERDWIERRITELTPVKKP
jgi:hypothetical protein